jgi:ferritin-like metal-binding protein YciE
MEKMNDLKDLLRHEVQDLYSAEDQIIAAMPSMIDKAKNPELKRALQNHLKVSEQQRSRLEQVQNILTEEEEETTEEKRGLLSRLFKSKQVCRGMQGIIDEGSKVLNEDMDQDVRDAAIIASVQRIEHYEISGYGTARTYARELNLERVAQLLEQTLNEEYQADDRLTQLAEGRINKQAEAGGGRRGMEQMPGRSTSGRATTQERVRREEPEMEMAANRGRSSTTSKQTTPSRRSGEARGTETSRTRDMESPRTKGTESSRSTAASTRSTGTTSRGTSGGNAPSGRTTTTSGRSGAGGGRTSAGSGKTSTSGGRTGASSRTDMGSTRGTGRSSSGGRSDTSSRGSSRGR